jgi:hypothetical protein
MRLSLCATFALLAIAALPHPAAGAPAVWKIVDNAFLRVNDEGVKEWSAFQIEKKEDRFLIQLADRFLLIDAQQKQAFEIASADIQHNGSDILWDAAKKPSKPLATSGWLVRDVGFAQRIKMHLDAEDRTLDLQVPHRFTRP